MYSKQFLDYISEFSLDSAPQVTYDSPPVLASEEIFIPLSVLKSHSALQSIVHYLKDAHKLSYVQIARILNRDQRTIWVTYHAKKIDYTVDDSLMIPVSIIARRNLSVLESIVFYLITAEGLSIIELSRILGKNYQTVRTVYKRALTKL